jgi:pSer/pThr/pTyr-binding forkhead associated (FHA) protein
VPAFWIKYRGSRVTPRQGETVVGRSPYCSLVINNPRVSRQHCALKYDGETLIVTDLGSSNGTWVNGELVGRPRALGHGDVLTIGLQTLEVEQVEPNLDRSTRRTERDLPAFRQADEDFEQSVTQVQAASVALVESLVRNAAESKNPPDHFEKIRRVVATCLTPRPTSEGLTVSELRRLKDCINASVVLDPGDAAAAWRETTLAHPLLQSFDLESSAPPQFPSPADDRAGDSH